MIRYEDLVTETEAVLTKVTSWLGVAMEDDMLRHSEMMSRVVTSPMETTSDQIVRPVYTEALDKWRGNIDPQLLTTIIQDNLKGAAALRQLGYTPFQ